MLCPSSAPLAHHLERDGRMGQWRRGGAEHLLGAADARDCKVARRNGGSAAECEGRGVAGSGAGADVEPDGADGGRDRRDGSGVDAGGRGRARRRRGRGDQASGGEAVGDGSGGGMGEGEGRGGEEKRRRVELPGYAFERERYWIERGRAGIESVGAGQGVLRKKEDIADWFYVPVWKQSILPVPPVSEKSQENKTTWLVFMDASGLTSRLVKELEQDGHDVISVTEGQHYARLADTLYSINPLARDDYDTLLMHLQSQQRRPQRILHCWSVSTLHALSSTEQVAPN